MLGPFRAFIEVIRLALQSCWQHPLRTGLSGLAIAAAVATIAVVVTSLDGVENFARDASARTFGSDTFVVAQLIPGSLSRKELELRLQRNPVIKRNDYRFLDRYGSNEVLYAPIAQARVDIIAGSRKFEGASLNGTDSTMFDIRELGVSAGRFFRSDEAAQSMQLAVLGSNVADELFPGLDPLQKTVRIAGRGFRVIGVQTEQGTAGGVSLDRYVWIPLRAFERTLGPVASLQVFAKAKDDGPPELAEDRARATLRARRKLRPGSDDNFDILSPEAARGFVLRLASRIGAAAGPISLMALLAAVVVVTNTSLVSVTQQTREIGIRRALGARRARIMAEVVAESTVVAVLGGLAGVFVAWLLLNAASRGLGFELVLQPSTVTLSMAAAGLSGIFSGVYPARRAAAVEVIQALHNE